MDGLDYSAHPTALDRLREVCARVAAEYDVHGVAAVHRIGTLAIGDIAVVVATTAAHRGVAFDASRALIDTLKAEVPDLEAPALRRRQRGVGRHAVRARSRRTEVPRAGPQSSDLEVGRVGVAAASGSNPLRVSAPPAAASAYPDRVEILLWLVPPIVVTVVAMVWVTWLGREGRGEVDPDVAAARLAGALEQGLTPRYARRAAPAPHRSTGVAVRPSRARRTAPSPSGHSATRRAS